MATYSIVVPVYNEELYLVNFFNAIRSKIIGFEDFEIIFVNDGSTDFSGDILKKLSDENDIVRVVKLDKNYGKEAAYAAGMSVASGDAVVLMSLSPKNPINVLNKMISKWLSGSKIVHAYRDEGKSAWWQGFKYRTFAKVAKWFGIKGTLLPKPTVELYDRDVVDILNALPDRHTFLRNTNVWVDYKITTIEYKSKEKNQIEPEELEKLKKEFAEVRKENNIGDPKPVKKRIYAPFLWTSCYLFIAGAITMILVLSLQIANLLTGFNVILVWILIIVLFIASLIYYFRSKIIKRLGIIPGYNKKLCIYKIEELIGFDCLID